jgi:hypothetical protein
VEGSGSTRSYGTVLEFFPVGSRGRSKGGPCHGSDGYLPAFHSRNLGSIPGECMWDLWQMLVHVCCQVYFNFPVSALYSFSQLSPSCVILATDSIVK